MPRPTALLAAAALTLAGASGLTATSIASASTLKVAQSAAASPTITIGSTNFPEQVIVANLYSDVLRKAGFKTNVRADLGTRTAVEPALAHGSLDLFPDYAGSLLSYLKPKDTAPDHPAQHRHPGPEGRPGAAGGHRPHAGAGHLTPTCSRSPRPRRPSTT